jgi:hypothetical protein
MLRASNVIHQTYSVEILALGTAGSDSSHDRILLLISPRETQV